MRELASIKPNPRSYDVVKPTYSELLQAIIPRNNGTQQGIEALRASIERSKAKCEGGDDEL